MTKATSLLVATVFALVLANASSAGVKDGVETGGALIVPPAPVDVQRIYGSVMIDFDDVTQPCFFIDTVALRDEYTARGVLFSGPGPLDGGAILDECGSFGVSGHSSPNFLAFNCNATLADGGTPTGPETLTCDVLVSLVEVLVGSSSGAGATLSMQAFDEFDNPVDMSSVVLEPVLQSLSVGGEGIKTVVIGTTQPCVWVLDDLGFALSPVSVDDANWGEVKGKYREAR